MVAMPFIYCETAHKRRYDSQIACLYDNAGRNPKSYRCPSCGGWHLTSSKGMRQTWFKGGRELHEGIAARKRWEVNASF